MIKKLRQIIASILTGASVVTTLLCIATGYIDHMDPTRHGALGCIGMVFPFMVIVNVALLAAIVIVKWQRMWVPIAGLAAVYPAIRVVCPLNMSETPPEGSIKVLSYNVCVYNGARQCDDALNTIMDYLKSENADIVTLQEDEVRGKDNAMERLKKLYEYNDTMHLNGNNGMVNVIGIHTRYPIVKRERIDYESANNGSAAYHLLVDGDTVIVVNNHLESTHLKSEDRERYKSALKGEMSRDEARQEARYLWSTLGRWTAKRAPQARAVHDYVEAHRDKPLIVAGDFNDTPLSYARHTIAQGLTDCYVAAGKGPGLSYNKKGFNFRIDHMMCSDHWQPYQCRVDSKIKASDHYPIMCWLKRADKTSETASGTASDVNKTE